MTPGEAMTRATDAIRRLSRDERGAAAVIVALALPVLAGAGALAVDLSQYRFIDNRLQSAADAAALAAVRDLDDRPALVATALDFAGRNVPASFGTVTGPDDVVIGIFDAATGTFTPDPGPDANAVRVAAVRSPDRGNAPRRFLGLMLGEGAATIGATAIAARQLTLQYEPPERLDLDPDAGDFNEMYAYCFDYEGSGPPESRRSQMTLIANNLSPAANANIGTVSHGNAQPVPAEIDWPVCGRGESLSFRLRNIRHAKAQPVLWGNPNAEICISGCGGPNPVRRRIGRAEHNHFTDTVISGGSEQYNLVHNVLETFRCDSANCATELADGTIPRNQRNRTPNVETRPCMPGRYMYFGWEDRPPSPQGQAGHWTDPGWTDTDYDDIVIVLRCPVTGVLGDGMARLVR